MGLVRVASCVIPAVTVADACQGFFAAALLRISRSAFRSAIVAQYDPWGAVAVAATADAPQHRQTNKNAPPPFRQGSRHAPTLRLKYRRDWQSTAAAVGRI